MGFEILRVVISVTVISLVAETTVGCGITTHTEVAHRAIEYFEDNTGNVDYKQLILENQDAFTAGNPYPDSFYPDICKRGVYNYVSEDTHWTPFLKLTADYIRDTYPHPWNQDTRKLVAFLLGFASHQVADASFHSLGIPQGFLTTMGDINYFGSFSKAHTDGDVGGDVLSVTELDVSYISFLSDWYIPVKDLYKLYKLYYGSVIMQEDVIIQCSTLLFLGRLGEQFEIFARLYGFFSKRSPFMLEEFEPYFLGGVDDMASLTQTLWHEVIFMLEHGSSDCAELPRNPLYINCTGSMPPLAGADPDSKWNTSMRGLRTKVNVTGLSMNDVKVTTSARGVYISPSDAMKAKLKSLSEKVQNEQHKRSNSSAVTDEPASTFYVVNTYARLGWSMTTAELNGDQNEDLIIGAAGYGKDGLSQIGRVYLIYGSDRIFDKGSLDLDQDADVILQGFYAGGRFGTGVAALDLNVDGYMDIAISAPSVGSKGLTYTGEVYVFFGNQERKYSVDPDVTITCTLTYCNLGFSLAAGDVDLDGNLDLLLGSPFAPANDLEQAGMVSILLAGTHFQSPNTVHLTEEDIDFTFKGQQDYGWFGYRVSLKTKPGLTPLLLMSQPTYRICANPDCSHSPEDTQSVGSLYMYSQQQFSAFYSVLRGQDSFAKLGSAMAVGDPFGNGSLVLAVASNTKDVKGRFAGASYELFQAGQVSLYNVDFVLSDSHSHRHLRDDDSGSRNGYPDDIFLDMFSTYEGDRRYGRLGGEIMFEDVTGDGIDDFIVSSPYRKEDLTEVPLTRPLRSREEGTVYVYRGGPSFDVGDVTRQCKPLTLVEPCPSDKAYAVLSSKEVRSRFGSKMTAWKFNEKTHLVVSAPRSDQNARLGGQVYIYTL